MNALLLIATLAMADNTQQPVYIVRQCEAITQTRTIWSLHTAYWDVMCDDELHIRHSEWEANVDVQCDGRHFYVTRFSGATLIEVRSLWHFKLPDGGLNPCGDDWYRMWKNGIDPSVVQRDMFAR